MDRDLDYQTWAEDEARFEAEDEAAWQEAERRSEADLEQSVEREAQQLPPEKPA